MYVCIRTCVLVARGATNAVVVVVVDASSVIIITFSRACRSEVCVPTERGLLILPLFDRS